MAHQHSGGPEAAKVTCPKCGSRLEVVETPSGGRIVSMVALSEGVEPKQLELFLAPDAGPDITCPACTVRFDPAAPVIRVTHGRRPPSSF
jgi:hypothetical protein